MADTDFSRRVTERLVLRRFDPADLDAFVAYRADPDVARYQGWGESYDIERGRTFLAELAAQHPDTAGEWFQFAIERRAEPRLIGDCAAGVGEHEAAVEIGFTLASAHHGKGYATEAVGELLAYLHERGHRRVVASIDPRNMPSRGVLERLGFELTSAAADDHRYHREL